MSRFSRPSASLAFLLVLSISLACASVKKAEKGARGFQQSGVASWYGPGFHGKRTANGEVYDMNAMTAAHKHLPFDTVVEVTNHDNGKRLRVRINDRGPFVRGRIIDLSRAAAKKIDMIGAGTARVTLRVVKQPARKATSLSSVSGYRVQLGAFRDGHRAEKLREDARRIRKDVRVRLAGSLFLVELGPFKKKKQADEVVRRLEKAGFEAVTLAIRD